MVLLWPGASSLKGVIMPTAYKLVSTFRAKFSREVFSGSNQADAK